MEVAIAVQFPRCWNTEILENTKVDLLRDRTKLELENPGFTEPC